MLWKNLIVSIESLEFHLSLEAFLYLLFFKATSEIKLILIK